MDTNYEQTGSLNIERDRTQGQETFYNGNIPFSFATAGENDDENYDNV